VLEVTPLLGDRAPDLAQAQAPAPAQALDLDLVPAVDLDRAQALDLVLVQAVDLVQVTALALDLAPAPAPAPSHSATTDASRELPPFSSAVLPLLLLLPCKEPALDPSMILFKSGERFDF